jgi:hypothetical protein
MKPIRLVLLFSIIVFSFYSCKKDTSLPPDLGYKYFPVNVGHWVLYDVDSVSYNEFTGLTETYHFQIREIVESVYTDSQGRVTQRLERYKKTSDTTAWFLKDVWAENLTATTAEKVEENIRIVKLIFPPSEGAEWDGNGYNDSGEQTYTYQDVNKPYVLNATTFDSTVSILQKDIPTIISDNYEFEVYASHIGLIYKKYVDISKLPSGIIKSGIDYSYTLNSFGN